jgi:hypothetical protein
MSFFGADLNPAVARTRGSYANPHATIAVQDIPVQIKQLFRLTRFYFCTDSLLRAIIMKMAEYPITNIILEDPDERNNERTKEKWDTLINVSLNLRQMMVNINVDKYIFGNSFHYLYLPFVRYVKCTNCGSERPIKAIKKLTVIAGKAVDDEPFTFGVNAICPACSHKHEIRSFTVEDRPSQASEGLKFIRMNPLRMELEYNSSSAERDWYWLPPSDIKDQFLNNVRVIVNTTEMVVLKAVMLGRKLKMNSDRLWVAQSETMPGIWEGWGFPPIFPALEDVYYYKILRRANEALAQEHITPVRFITPSATGDVSPHRSINLSDWQVKLRADLQKFKRDPNHIVLSPVPVSVEQMGGNARVMMVAQEMEAAARVIAAAVGCPIEMIWGGLNWSGASVSLRVLENHFLNERESSERLLRFLLPRLARHYRLPTMKARLADFKMADDVQREQNYINLMVQGFASRKSVLPELGLDYKDEMDQLVEEHKLLNDITMRDNLAASHMKTVIEALEAKANILLQYELQLATEAMQAAGERTRLQNLQTHVQALHKKGYATPLELDQSAHILGNLQPAMQNMILSTWAQTMPMVTRMLMLRGTGVAAGQQAVQQALANTEGPQSMGAAAGPGMDPGAAGPYSEGGSGGTPVSSSAEPLPEQRPPRRQGT